MSGVRVVSDSAVCLPKQLIEKYNIELVPETIIFGTKVYRDGVDLVPSEFYVKLGEAKDLPTTSAPSPQDFIDAYQKVGKDADAIACILVTAGFSHMGLQAALTARESVPQPPIEIFDSRTALGAYGFIVLAAAKAAAAGKSLPEVLQAAKDVQKRVNLILTLDTLKYLAKGGASVKPPTGRGRCSASSPSLRCLLPLGFWNRWSASGPDGRRWGDCWRLCRIGSARGSGCTLV